MRYARSTLLAVSLVAAASACSDDVLQIPTDASTSDRAVDAPAARADAGAATDASASSDVSTASDDADGGVD
jgi:hypothetical protein